MAIEYTLDQRLYRLGLSKKDIYEQCKARGKRISYEKICEAVNFPMEADLKYTNIVKTVVSEIEAEREITDIYFDRR